MGRQAAAGQLAAGIDGDGLGFGLDGRLSREASWNCRASGSCRMSGAKPFELTHRSMAILAVISLGALAVTTFPFPPDQPRPLIGLAILVVTVALFATGALHGLATSAIFFVLALLTESAMRWSLLSNVWSNATMLIFGGLILGAAAERSGLGRFVARNLLQRFLTTYSSLLLGILVGTGALSFLVPSTMGRLAITVPIVISIAREVGYTQGAAGHTGMVLAAVAGNFMTSYAILPANLLGVILTGTAEGLYGPQLSYAEYFLLCAPVLGLAKGLTFWLLLRLLFRAPPPAIARDSDPAILTPAARRLAVLLTVTVALWATDVLHGLRPGWIAFAAGILCLLPPVSLVTLRESFDVNRITGVITVPVMLGLATVLTQSGAGDLIARFITTMVPLEGRSATFGFAAVAVFAAISSVIATTVGCVAIVTPLLGSVGAATGLSIKAGLVAELTGLQALFFHYEAMPIMVGLMMGRVSPAAAVRFLVPLAITGFLVILPLNILWLKLLGYLP